MIKFNLKAYELLFDIENALREFISANLENKYGKDWFLLEHVVPKDISESCILRKKEEEDIYWIKKDDFHPLYYCNFPDLRKILFKKANWNNIFNIILNIEEAFLKHKLNELDAIRNIVAHNRDLTKENYQKLLLYKNDFERTIFSKTEIFELSTYKKAHHNRILVVDDADMIRILLRQLLENDGYEVDTATSVDEALDYFEKNDYGLILLDLIMPEKTGDIFVKHVRKLKPRTNIIIVTGFPDERMTFLSDLGVTTLIEKPFDEDVLLNAIKKVLP